MVGCSVVSYNGKREALNLIPTGGRPGGESARGVTNTAQNQTVFAGVKQPGRYGQMDFLVRQFTRQMERQNRSVRVIEQQTLVACEDLCGNKIEIQGKAFIRTD
jgi:hypothetical protein